MRVGSSLYLRRLNGIVARQKLIMQRQALAFKRKTLKRIEKTTHQRESQKRGERLGIERDRFDI